MVCQKPTLTHCRAQTNVHNSCVPRTWRRQASGQITRSAVPGIATRFPFFANRKIRNGRTFSRRASTHALTLQANGLYNRDSHVKDKMVSPTVLSLTWESPYLEKTVFILIQGPGFWCCCHQQPGYWPGRMEMSVVLMIDFKQPTTLHHQGSL